jgi:two-component system cell cycle response regulator DivK
MPQNGSFLEGKRVLIIEDREENRRLLRAILKLEGATTLEAEDGRAGIEIAARELPDLILMDFQMPGLDGAAATRLLRQNPRTGALPIVFITASASAETRRDALEAGGDGVLTKPIDPLQFSSQIAVILANIAPQT